MMRVGTALLVSASALLLGSCSGDDETPKGQYAEQCNNTPECAEGLECINSLCTIRCSSNTECRALSPTNGFCSGAVCYDACRSNFGCPNGLTCVMNLDTQGTCRVFQ
ncbi:MAG: hypothetical protein PVI30_11145 [Myxococcales bacterium]|jgi:hypothetical protein